MNRYDRTQTALTSNGLQSSRPGESELAVESVEARADDEEGAHHTPDIGNIAPDDEAGDRGPERRGVTKRRHHGDRAGAKRVDVEKIGEGHERAGTQKIKRFLSPEASPFLP